MLGGGKLTNNNRPVLFLCSECHVFKSSDVQSLLQHASTCAGQDVETITPDINPTVEPVVDVGLNPERFQWTKESTVRLTKLIERYKSQFNSNTVTRRKIWQLIAEDMQARGWALNWEQCDSKWKSLKRTYNSIKDKDGKKSGWEYFSMIDDMISNRPQFNTISTCSTLNVSGDDFSSNRRFSEKNSFMGAIRRRKKLQMKKVMLDPTERHHREKMDNQRRFLNLLEILIDKLD